MACKKVEYNTTRSKNLKKMNTGVVVWGKSISYFCHLAVELKAETVITESSAFPVSGSVGGLD